MCGIVGILNQKSEVAIELYESLVQLQHRGQDSAGIITCDTLFHKKIAPGLVRDIFAKKDIDSLSGRLGIGHVRYPTTGSASQEQAQPFWLGSPYGIALAHNGNLTNHRDLNQELRQNRRRHLNTDSDSETLIHLFADGFVDQPPVTNSEAFFEQICQSVGQITKQVMGSYSVVTAIIGKGLIAFRDPHGIRPLCMGVRPHQDGSEDIIIASENTSFFGLGFEDAGSIDAGEVVFVDLAGKIFRRTLASQAFRPCVFEYVYFARPDAKLNDISVYRSRLRMGQNLAKNWLKTHPDSKPDVVIPVPFTSNTAALAFAHELGVRYSEGLYKNPFIGRTFIMPSDVQRRQAVRYKLSPQKIEIKDKTVLLVDDSIVRGTTSREIVRMVRECGAKAVYLVSACPPVKFPCYYGINIPTTNELIAHNQSVEEIRNYIGVDILLYQDVKDLQEAVLRRGNHLVQKPCMACLDGDYCAGKISEPSDK
ncbi:MAG: amidophosphoribosyltransferase [Gammaproteobacteria bacterium]|nr:amidophosphoribosyltransferase [Gammaproteobacteria bacterium]